MSRITAAFEALEREGKKGFIPFITAGDPDLKTTEELLVALSASGASIIELGVPFSDPMADGPVIQRASERALRNKLTLDEIFAASARASKKMNTPLLLFSYFNPLLQYGLENICRRARQSGIDGILVTDLIPEEAEPFASLVRENDLDLIFLAAPTSNDERLQMIASRATGFIYAVSRAGVTGTQDEISAEAEKLVRRIRQFSNLPIAVGFGISNEEQVRETARYADAVVVGSAIVAELERAENSSESVERVRDLSHRLMLGLADSSSNSSGKR